MHCGGGGGYISRLEICGMCIGLSLLMGRPFNLMLSELAEVLQMLFGCC